MSDQAKPSNSGPEARREHGSFARYRAGCRCRACRAANAAVVRHRRRQQAYGRWLPLVDAEPVRAHVRGLQERGLGFERVAQLAGVSVRTVAYLLYGAPSKGLPPSRRIRPDSARALLAVRATDLPAAGWVHAAGTQRRLRALAAIGWSAPRLAEHLGMNPESLSRLMTQDKQRVTAVTAGKVRGLYDRLWNVPGPWPKARNWAARRGWPPPLAWDDDTIDDPAARPAAPTGGRRSRELWQDSEELRAQGLPLGEIADRLGVSLTALKRARERAQDRRRRDAGTTGTEALAADEGAA
jgi:transcriptional regulator with XRE-family HTH domain